MVTETLSKTWFVDIDGTIMYHHTNDSLDDMIEKYGTSSYLHEKPIPTAIEFFKNRPKRDRIVIATARESRHIEHTLKALRHHGMPFDDWVFELGAGPRVVVNDIKPPLVAGNKGPLKTAYGMDVERNGGITSQHYTQVSEIDSVV
tara:strand:- start:1893 stop:2330 length:438 start_codon:yes stop_codon:yes gene_type:complete